MHEDFVNDQNIRIIDAIIPRCKPETTELKLAAIAEMRILVQEKAYGWIKSTIAHKLDHLSHPNWHENI